METLKGLERVAGLMEAQGAEGVTAKLLQCILELLKEIKAQNETILKLKSIEADAESKDSSSEGEKPPESGNTFAAAAKKGARVGPTNLRKAPRKKQVVSELEPPRLLFYGLLRGADGEWSEIREKVLSRFETTFGIPRPIWIGRAGAHVIARFRTRAETVEAASRCYAVAIDEAAKGEYVSCLACPHVPMNMREKRDTMMRTMFYLLKYRQDLIREPVMLEVLHSTMEVCEEAKDIILPWIDELKKRDFSLRPISAATASALSVLATDTFTAAAADAVQRSSRSRAEGGFRRGFCLRKTNTLGRLAEEEKDGLPSDSGKNGSGPSGTNSAPTPRQGAAARREEDTNGMDGQLSPAEDTPMMETNEERQVISEPVATAAGASGRSRSRRRRRR